jgi:hypothetical protein
VRGESTDIGKRYRDRRGEEMVKMDRKKYERGESEGVKVKRKERETEHE